MRYSLNLRLLVFLSITLAFPPLLQAYAQDKAPPKFVQFTKPKAFGLPIDCHLGQDCHIMNYVDYGAGDEKKTDMACLARTYDTHKGTDFALMDGKAMEAGVDVIAPLKGTVVKIRDDAPDLWATPEQIEDIKENRKECGNAVLMDHGDGVKTIYCHMKQGSISVKPGQKLKQGDKIGQVGLSGFTAFPHLHFGIMKDKKIIDPFTGLTNKNKCGKVKTSLWEKSLNVKYQPFIIHANGFSNQIPNLDLLERDLKRPEKLSINSEILTYWVILWGVREGDNITLEIKDPNGKILTDQHIIQDKTRARQFYYIGKNLKNTTLSEGVYTGYVKLERAGKAGHPPQTQSQITPLWVTP